MHQIAYFSTSAAYQDEATIHAILISSRINNRRAAITGLLVAGGNRYLQVLEGPRDAVQHIYEIIRADGRHLAVTTLVERTIAQRCFEDWSMAYRREPDLHRFHSFPEVVRHLMDEVGDNQLRRQVDHFARSFIAAPATVAPMLWKQVN